ncbi:hypothetical protein [Streptomyces erythrochromogenes]|uniref:hypothetical protein n=1 Tax=Streptomyces erythrochromogenes TaxID=285574 RepID=UPI0036833092
MLAVAGAVMVALTGGCSTLPGTDELRAMATTDGARLKRDAEEARIRALLERFDEVEGLRYGFTMLKEECTGPSDGGLKEQATVHLMTCSMSMSRVFGVEGDVTDVLRRIDDAAITRWIPNGNAPGYPLAGTLEHALQYHRLGVFPDGRLMTNPYLNSDIGGVSIVWDYPPLPGDPGLVQAMDTSTCLPTSPIYSRCLFHPAQPDTVSALRARYGAVLAVTVKPDRTGAPYLTVPRPKAR